MAGLGGSGKKLSPDEERLVLDIYQSGVSASNLIVKYKLPRASVFSFLKEKGVLRRFAPGRKKSCKKCRKDFSPVASNHQYCDGCRGKNGCFRKIIRYNITATEYSELLKKQMGHCALCPDMISDVDHCHKTLEVRGLLCRRCNLGIGLFENDPGWIERAKKYLEHRS